MKALCIIDMQNDFIDGSLGSTEAQAIVDKIVDKINNFSGLIICTRDTHYDKSYSKSLEGQRLPVPHCIENTKGWRLNSKIEEALRNKTVLFLNKHTFGSGEMAVRLRTSYNPESIEICGVCTDICVLSNAIILRNKLPNTPIAVDAACCAGSTVARHKAALEAMKSCFIDVINENHE